MQKSITLFDRHDNHIQPGRKLGTGGEGDVFELNDNSVVKVYHQLLPAAKQNKLLAMSSTHTPPLLEISTWPIGTVHLGKQGPVGGLVMPRLVGYKEIHKLYGPAHRKIEFPSADWTFLIQTARNAAAAIAMLHQLGHVVGDINPGNIAVSVSALTKLIDCDSFQVKFNGQYYPCEVGVAHFTPPELQGKSFNNVIRTPNHDNFGLALLCFHLLFMGRHPFAGKYKDGKEDMSIEKAIREFRFAYGVKSASKGMSSPPNTLPLNIGGEELAQMFEAAFDQSGVFNGRPTASQWVKVLDNLRTSLVVCTRYSSHKFYRSLSDCPWCTLEGRSGTIFFLPTNPIKAEPTIDLAQIWQEILAITPPDSFYLPKFSFIPSPQPLPDFLLLPTAHSTDYLQEVQSRQAALVASETAWNEIEKRWPQEVSDAEFSVKIAELKNLHKRIISLNTKLANDKQKLEAKAKDLQLCNYLEKQHLDNAKINGIGPTRKAILASYGIETAADIDQTKIVAIPGFGLSLSLGLVLWRKNLESKFVYNPHNITVSVEASRLQYQYDTKYASLESALLSGVEELKQIKEKIRLKRKVLVEDAEKQASAYAQAQANWTLLKSNLEQVQRREASKLAELLSGKSSIDVSTTQAPGHTSTPQSLSSAASPQFISQTAVSQSSSSTPIIQSSHQNSLPQTSANTSTPIASSTSFPTMNERLPKTKKKFAVIDVIAFILILMLLFFAALLFYNTYV